MDEESIKRLEELRKGIDMVLGAARTGSLVMKPVSPCSSRNDLLHDLGFDQMTLNVEGARWEMYRIPG